MLVKVGGARGAVLPQLKSSKETLPVLFTSIEFYLFLTAVLLLYYVLSHRW
ncbi:MAG: hypothetical protein IPK16_11245 [Anaerolineales bacterium]|nr:hypothetical protein [Anaerolineales bacterium]